MKKIFLHLFLLVVFSLFSLMSYAQCKSFAKKICKLELGVPGYETFYIHDGNYHAAILTEGEEAELYKTFYSEQEYRIAICGSEALPDIEFKVIDGNRNVLYSNKDNNFKRVWDFKLESTQQLKIAIKVKARENIPPEEVAHGCVAIMFGFKDK